MDKGLEKAWEIALAVLTDHRPLAVALVIGATFAYQCPSLLKEWLSHRREMWRLKNTERRRKEGVKRRRRITSAKRKKP